MSSGSLPKAAGAEYLTEVLRRSGLLGHDRVREVIVDSSRETILSRIVRLRLEHGDEPVASLTLILKSGLADRNFGEWHPGRQEVAFYREVAPVISGGLLPRCFDAEW